MAEGVIHNLELIEVQVKQCMFQVRVLVRFFQRHDQSIFEFAAVDQSGKGIVRRLVGKLAKQAGFLTDIMEYHHGSDDVADSIPNRCRGILNRHFCAIFVYQYGVVGKRDYAPLSQTAYYRVFDRRSRMLVDNAHDVFDRLAARIAALPTGKTQSDRIEVVNAAVCIGCNDTVADRLKRNLRSFFFFEHARFRHLALGNIRNSAFVSSDFAVVIEIRGVSAQRAPRRGEQQL